jgi:hypothetical protein
MSLRSVLAAAVVFGLLGVLSAGEILRAGGLAPGARRVLDRVAVPLFVAFCLVVGSQLVQFV